MIAIVPLDLKKTHEIETALDELDRFLSQMYFEGLTAPDFHKSLQENGLLDSVDLFCDRAGIDADQEIEVYCKARLPKEDIAEKEGFVLPTFSFSEFLDYDPTPEKFLIEGILPEGAPTVMYGAGGVGKSYLTLQQAVSLATGLPYLDKFKVPEAKQVLLIAQEDSKNQIHWRVKRIVAHLCQVHGLVPSDLATGLANIIVIDFAKLRAEHRKMKRTFTDPSEEFFNCVRATVESLDNVGLIIADPLNKLYGEDLNANDLATDFMVRIEDLCESLNVTVEIVHHKNKAQDSMKYRTYSAGGSLGAASFINGARHAIEIDKADKANDKIPSELKRKTFIHNIAKSNYMGDGDSRTCYLQKDFEGVMSYFDVDAYKEEAEASQQKEVLDSQTKTKELLTIKCLNALNAGPLRKMEFYKALGYERTTGVKKLTQAIDLGIVVVDTDGKVQLRGES